MAQHVLNVELGILALDSLLSSESFLKRFFKGNDSLRFLDGGTFSLSAISLQTNTSHVQ